MQNQVNQLPAYKVTFESGFSYVTSMAKGISLADAQAYFLGNLFNVGSPEDEDFSEKCVQVEKVR